MKPTLNKSSFQANNDIIRWKRDDGLSEDMIYLMVTPKHALQISSIYRNTLVWYLAQ